MKISMDDQEVCTLSEIQKQVIMHDIHEDIFEDDMKRRVQYVLMHKYDQCFKRFKQEWEPKLAESGVEMIPTNAEAFAKLVFSQPAYKSRSNKEKEANS